MHVLINLPFKNMDEMNPTTPPTEDETPAEGGEISAADPVDDSEEGGEAPEESKE